MIYFIKHTDYVKVGYTNNLDKRLSQLQVSCPVRLEVLSVIRGNMDKESEIHSMFLDISSSGEWFHYCPKLQKYIDDTYDNELMWELGYVSDEKTIMSKFKQARIRKNINSQEAADLLKTTRQAILDMEDREIIGRVTIRTLQLAAKAIGCEFSYRVI